MYVCMYVRMYVYMYVFIYVCMYICMYLYMYVCLYAQRSRAQVPDSIKYLLSEGRPQKATKAVRYSVQGSLQTTVETIRGSNWIISNQMTR